MKHVGKMLAAALICVPTIAYAAPVIGGTTAAIVTADVASIGLDVTPFGTTTTDGTRVLFGITGGDLDPATLAGTILHAGAGLNLETDAGLVTASNFTIDTVARRIFADVALNGTNVATQTALFRFNLSGLTAAEITDLDNPQLSLLVTGRASQLLTRSLDIPRLAGQEFAVAATAPVLGAVPEPATWGMLIFGFGIVGGRMRARKTALAFN